MSSFHESLPLDWAEAAKISGQASSDFMNDSLPPDLNNSRNSMTLSLTSREEFCGVSEVEVMVSTMRPKSKAKDDVDTGSRETKPGKFKRSNFWPQ